MSDSFFIARDIYIYERSQRMNTAVGLAIIGALVAILLWQNAIPDNQEPVPEQHEPFFIIKEEPVYNYPVTFTSNPWRIPAYSYGSTYEYRRFHSPIVHPRQHGPSVIPRIAMSHPIHGGSGGGSGSGSGGAWVARRGGRGRH